MSARKQAQQAPMFAEAKWRTDTLRTSEGFIRRRYLNAKFHDSVNSIPSIGELQKGISAFMKRPLVVTGRNEGQVQKGTGQVWIDLYIRPEDPFAAAKANGGAA